MPLSTITEGGSDTFDSVSEIIPDFLYIGNKLEAQSQDIRSRYGITHVLSVYPNVDASQINLPPSRHLILSVEDNDSSDLLREFSATYDFIESALLDNGKILVHCAQGISRSSTVVAAYLIRKREMTADGALDFIRKGTPQSYHASILTPSLIARPWIQPSLNFLTQLDIYEYSHDPSPNNRGYRDWTGKRTSKKTFSKPAFYRHETIVAFSDKLFMRVPLRDPQDSEKLFEEIKVTHLVGPVKTEYTKNIDFCLVDASSKSIFDAASFIHDAIRGGGVVLLYAPEQALSWTILFTYLLANLKLHPVEAHSVLDSAKDVKLHMHKHK
ncbi:phosphatases II [Hymenopellis radicata]|nr:phosphatases II [Hymenopellis radicata]